MKVKSSMKRKTQVKYKYLKFYLGTIIELMFLTTDKNNIIQLMEKLPIVILLYYFTLWRELYFTQLFPFDSI